MGLIQGGLGCVATIASFLVILFAVFIALVTAYKLQNVTVTPSLSVGGLHFNTTESTCILGSEANTGSNCILLETAAGVTIALAIVVGILQCITCHLCGLGGILDMLFAVAGATIWAATSAIVTDAKNTANQVDVNPHNAKWRSTVVAMSWIEFALFAFIIFVGLMKCCTHGKA